jgi:hypothetical protein
MDVGVIVLCIEDEKERVTTSFVLFIEKKAMDE